MDELERARIYGGGLGSAASPRREPQSDEMKAIQRRLYIEKHGLPKGHERLSREELDEIYRADYFNDHRADVGKHDMARSVAWWAFAIFLNVCLVAFVAAVVYNVGANVLDLW